jgi:multimeric flavodoxin WrbA
MAINLLCLLGSPRRGGNSDLLAAEVCAGFESAGGSVQTVALSELDVRPCTGCNGCVNDRPETCVIDDDMTDIYAHMLAADALLWATPVYSWAPSAQMKIVLDRQFAWGEYQNTRHARALAGRPVGLAVCYGDPDPATNGFFHCYHILKIVSEASGGRFAGCVHGPAGDPGEIHARPDVLAQGRGLGEKLYRLAEECRRARP